MAIFLDGEVTLSKLLRVWVLLLAAYTPVSLANQVDQWLHQHQVVRVGVPQGLMPLIGMQDGQAVGIDVDMLRLVQQHLGVSWSWVPCGSWEQCLEALQQRNIDLLSSMSYSIERNRYAQFTRGYWQMPWGYVDDTGQTDDNHVVTLSSLPLVPTGVVKGYSIVEPLRDETQIPLLVVNNVSEGLDALRWGEIEAYVDALPILVYAIQQRPIPQANVKLLEGAPGEQLFFGVRDDWQPLVMLLNRAITDIDPAEKLNIRRKWYSFELEQGWSDEELLDIGLKAGSAVLVVVLAFLIWNSRLRREIERRKAAERQIRYIATHDELTGLPNRNLFRDRLSVMLTQHERERAAFALMFLDLDGFKEVNDEHGHDYGDRLLVEAAQRMRDMLRKSDTVCRMGGDEFVVLLPHIESAEHACVVAQKLIKTLAQPYHIDGQTLAVSVSVGISLYPEHAKTEAQLLKLADAAMYTAKSNGKDGFQLATLDG
ncbi:hypothetical protein CWI84_09120 [Idiomarina tyrosinivorans]|uniref:GGDEF domain-containing protein n=1 Tax=Idiomarina tyrosinivorans TaxID=1445662 RepID=A0A432ZPF1_9GAMM|nr:diguanylate cyclase [Idiomarina tyrosinivorans]RUO79779.1 hypothetical protein CWI84_09120 [Idiomarina tyrosinivorans]